MDLSLTPPSFLPPSESERPFEAAPMRAIELPAPPPQVLPRNEDPAILRLARAH